MADVAAAAELSAAPRRVLVTGAGGFIGGALVRALAPDHAVTATARRELAGAPPGVEVARLDVRDREACAAILRGVDVCVHLACLPLGESERDPGLAFEVNTTGTVNVALAARAAGARVVVASTSQVYGDVDAPADESRPVRPAGAYAASKAAAEAMLAGLGADSVVLRLSNVYGAVPGRSTVEALFARAAVRGGSLAVQGHPDDARDFLHVDDAVKGIKLALSGGSGVLNIASGRSTTIMALAEQVVDQAGPTGARVVDQTSRQRPRLRIELDVGRANRELGFKPSVELPTGLARLLDAERIHCGARK